MGVGSEVDMGFHHVAGPQGESLGYRWFVGGEFIGHDGPTNNGCTSTAMTNAIITAAGQSRAAMVAAMPTWLSTWYQGLDDSIQAMIFHQMRYHPDVT